MTTVGYYDIASGDAGSSHYADPITEAGQQAVPIDDLTAADLQGLDTLFLLNPDNGGYGREFLRSLDAVWEFARQGGTVIIHDRYVEGAESILPDLPGADIRRALDEDRQIDFVDDSGPVTDGPGGPLDDDSLDNGNSSNHGYALLNSLPATVTAILTTDDPNHVVTFSYASGQGTFIYSSIPLDFYLVGSGLNFDNYAANLLNAAAIETVTGTEGDDFIHTAGDGRVPPPGSNDLPIATAGNDQIDGLQGSDVMYGDAGIDRLFGGGGRDVLVGGADSDVLRGGGGGDVLRGGRGADDLWGEAGADRFVFRFGARDVIRDFSSLEGDRIDLHRIDADTGAGGDQAFAFIDDAEFGGAAGELRYAGGVVQGDIDGNGAADFELELAGSPALIETDFVL